MLSENGLKILLKGNGFVINSNQGLTVKASSVSRNLSKVKLEQKFEPFAQTKNVKLKSINGYRNHPLDKGIQSMELYSQFEKERTDNQKAVSERLKALSLKKKKLFNKALKKSKLKRKAINLMASTSSSKKVMHQIVNLQYKKDANKIKARCFAEKNEILNSKKRLVWSDWLQLKATEGNIDAIEVLRYRSSCKPGTNNFSGSNHREENIDTTSIDYVTKEGTIAYKVGTSSIKDNGNSLSISGGLSQDDLTQVIREAKEKHGRCITAKGSELFKKNLLLVLPFAIK